MSPFFTLQRQLSYEPQRRLPVAVVVGTPPDPQRARQKLVIEALHTRLSYFRTQALAAPQLQHWHLQSWATAPLADRVAEAAQREHHEQREHA